MKTGILFNLVDKNFPCTTMYDVRAFRRLHSGITVMHGNFNVQHREEAEHKKEHTHTYTATMFPLLHKFHFMQNNTHTHTHS